MLETPIMVQYVKLYPETWVAHMSMRADALVSTPACTSCPASKYQPASGSTSCLDCPAGQFTNAATGSALLADCTDTFAPTPAPTPDPIGSWTDLQTIIDAGGLSGTITLAETFNCDYNSQIEIKYGKPVTIHANGAICNAQQGGRFFWVKPGATLTLNGMTLKNGSSILTLNGFVSVLLLWLAICNTSATHTPSCNTPFPQPPCAMLLQTLLQHHVDMQLNCNKGGAIFIYYGGTLNINGCTFEGNTATRVSVNL
jgi:hypothetical protein